MSTFKTIACIYGASEAALVLGALEAHGIDVLTADRHTALTLTDLTHAAGGIQIAVPADQEDAAYDILASLGPYDPPRIKEWVVAVLLFAWFFAGTPPPATRHPPQAYSPCVQRSTACSAKAPD